MDAEVVVVGAGVGGLTVAALLAARGVDVCVLERESRVGGCVANFEKFDYLFEPGYGLYSGWQPGEIHYRVFSQLPVEPPEVRLHEPSYVVRLPDKSEVRVTGNTDEFEENLRTVFPECAEGAIDFYRQLALVKESPKQFSETKAVPTEAHLEKVSLRFRRFIEVQLQALTQGGIAQVSISEAARTLGTSRPHMYAMRGGAATLAESLADSIRKSGGRIRLNTPVLRLSYDSSGDARGVDLLSGETVTASKAIVSNLTLWDTYGKLVGLNRTPNEIRNQMKLLRSWGSYLIFAGLDVHAVESISASKVIALTDWGENANYDPENHHFFFAPAPEWDSRGPVGKRAVTIHAFTNVDDWFTFHHDESELEEHDQQMLEACWQRLHAAMPELGGDIEVIDTATPRTFYDLTRRKLGMTGGFVPNLDTPNMANFAVTFLPNLFIVSDTFAGCGIAGLTRSALSLANKLTE